MRNLIWDPTTRRHLRWCSDCGILEPWRPDPVPDAAGEIDDPPCPIAWCVDSYLCDICSLQRLTFLIESCQAKSERERPMKTRARKNSVALKRKPVQASSYSASSEARVEQTSRPTKHFSATRLLHSN